jgi:chemotaxis protein methyltransferase CheR
LASDISEKVLAKARRGHFSELEINRGLSPLRKTAYFHSETDQTWRLEPAIQQLIEFQVLNLRTPFALPKQFDLVLCRNVLIYQRVKAKMEIIERVSSHLRPGGIFLMGSGESLIGLSTEFEQTLIDGIAVYRKKKQHSKII